MRLSSLLGGFALLVMGSLALADPKFVVVEKGIAIDAGPMGQFKIDAPILNLTKGSEKAVFTKTKDDQATAEYPSGLQLSYQVKAGSFSVHFTNAPADAKSLKFTMGVPIDFSRGGKYAFDAAELKPLPPAKAEQFVQHGNAISFTLTDATDKTFTLVTPGGYQGLQDNRTFGTQSFGYQYQFDLNGRKEGYANFSLKLPAGEKNQSESAGEPRKLIVDRFGQSVRKDFVGKVTTEEELKADGDKQLAEMAAFKPDPKLDAFGGLAGSGDEYKLDKTGFFHLARIGDRHVLVTPAGNVFFQLGMCGIARTDDDTTVKGRENIFEWLPPTKGDFSTAWRDNNPGMGVASFYIANWIRKFAKPYTLDEWSGQVVARLRSWGFNSAGAFSAQTDAMKSSGFPTVSFLPLGKGDGVEVLPDRIGAADLLDPFVPGTEEALEKRFAKSVAARANDPLLIGYFLGNEQHFEILPKLIPTYKASKTAAKGRLVQMLVEKYKSIGDFNTAWNPATAFSDFESLKDAPLFVRTDAANSDMHEFYQLYLETYYSMVHRVFKKYDTNHLLIGSRWTPGTANNKDAVEIGSKYLDVISINYYSYTIDRTFLNMVYERSGHKPMIFSEWYYSSDAHGLGSHVEVKDEKERGAAYRNYVEQSAATPYVVGSQWFIYGDQALTGRFFEGFHGEGNNTGFVDVTDRPYTELVDAAKITNARIYDVMLAKTKAFVVDDPRFNGSSNQANNRSVQVPRALPGMKLDGTTSGWPGRPAEPIESGRLVLGKPNPKLRGDYRLAWDETNLYFHIQIKDPTPLMNNKSGDKLWAADGVELFVGPKHIDATGNMIFSDRQILIGGSETPSIYILDHAEGSKLCSVVVVKDVAGDGYALMATIPWKVLDAEPKSGADMLFDVVIDNSDDGDARLQQLAWNGTSQNSHDRAAWGRLRLVDN